MRETLMMVLILAGMPLVIIIMASWLLHYVVALKSPPAVRAAWLVGLSYLIASAVWLFGGPDGDRWEGPFVAVPGALIAFWWWRGDFLRDWLDDSDELPGDVEFANNDWRIGLLGIMSLILVAAVKVFLRNGALSQ